VTFKDLQRLVQSEPKLGDNQLLSKLRSKEFWIWGQTEHKQRYIGAKGSCCFNHIIGLPRKDGIEKPMFDYELLLYRSLLEPGFFNSVASLHSDDLTT
jgi:hypothetical protein